MGVRLLNQGSRIKLSYRLNLLDDCIIIHAIFDDKIQS